MQYDPSLNVLFSIVNESWVTLELAYQIARKVEVEVAVVPLKTQLSMVKQLLEEPAMETTRA